MKNLQMHLKTLLLSAALLASFSAAYAQDAAQAKLNVTVTEVTETTIALSYYVTGSPVDIYWYEYFLDGVSQGQGLYLSDSYTFKGLKPGTTYKIKAVAQDINEAPVCTWEQTITTAAGESIVYFDNSEAQWEDVYIYAFGDGTYNADWPGVPMSQLIENGNIWVGRVSKTFPKIIFNKGMAGTEAQTADLACVPGRIYHKASKTTETVGIAGTFNGWSTTANTSNDVNGEIATFIVPNFTNGSSQGDGFKVVVNGYSTSGTNIWYGGYGNPQIGTWFDSMGDANMWLKTADGSENYQGDVKFTVDYTNGHLLAEACNTKAHHIEWVGLEKGSDGKYKLDLHTDNLTAPVMAYVCNEAGDRLPGYTITYQITEDTPNGIGSLFINSDNIVDARGLVLPEGSEGNKYGYKLVATVEGAGLIADTEVDINFCNLKKPEAKKISVGGYTTFCPLLYDVEIPQGVTAYTAKLDAANNRVVLTEVPAADGLKKDYGYIIKGDAGYSYVFTAQSATAPTDNELVGATTDKTGLTNVYALGWETVDGVSTCFFGPWDSAYTMLAGKAYLPVTSAIQAAKLEIVIDDEAPAIAGVAAKAAKAQGKTYNLAGQTVSDSFRGIIIRDGKKVIK